MGPVYGPMSQRLGRFRMPGQRMPSVMPDDTDSMPPGQGDLGEETMAGEQAPQDPRMVGAPDMGPMARAIMVHSPAEAKAQRGYAMPGLDVPGNPSIKSPIHGSGQGADVSDLHTAQHQSIARALNQRRWMAQQKLTQEHARLSQIVRGAKAGQNVEQAQQALATVEGMLKMLGSIPQGGPPGE